MKVVASTKLTPAQRAMAESKVYGAVSNTFYDQAEVKAIEGEGKKKLIIVCSSDKGLCGGIHSGLSRNVKRRLEKTPDADLVVIGEKCKAQLSRSHPKNIVLSFANIGKDVPTFTEAQAIADKISSLGDEYSDIEIVYNHFLNAQSYEPATITAFSEAAIEQSRMSKILCSSIDTQQMK
jgi:F-type H+-transporting ATPase subunit gamma